MKIEIKSILLTDSCQTRAALDPDVVEEYADVYRGEDADFPPLSVWQVEGKPVLVDGFHRLAAALSAGLTWIDVEVAGEGSEAEAAWYALLANQAHGLRRTSADKRRAVELALANPASDGASNRVIATQCGVSHTLVSTARAAWEQDQAPTIPGTSASGGNRCHLKPRRKGADGKTYPAARPPKKDAPAEPVPEGPIVGAALASRLTPAVAALVIAGEAVQALCREDATRRIGRAAEGPVIEALGLVRGAVPVRCPSCRGSGAACAVCRKEGWVTRATSDQWARSAKELR